MPDEARSYLHRRGVSPDDIVQHQIGWLPEPEVVGGWSREFYRWQARALPNAIIFPIYSVLGTVIGLQTRRLDEKRYEKFLAGPSDLFPPVFGLPQALPDIWRTEQVVLVEGVFDYFAVRRYTPNVLATLTASIPTSVRRFLRRYVQRTLVLLDMDEAGRAGVDLLIREHLPVFAPSYRAHDPGDLVAEGFGGDLATLVTSAKFPYSVPWEIEQ